MSLLNGIFNTDVLYLPEGDLFFSTEVAANLPPWMHEKLENETYGRDYLVSIDQELMRLKPVI